MKIVELVRQANRPGPPEHSVALRVAAGGAVLVGIAACRSQGELSPPVTLATMALVTLGMVFSYATRRRPRAWVKPTLAVAVVVAFAWFFHQVVSGTIGDIAAVEAPLAALFAWIQVTHAFDVPARRDLSFSLAGSASLMAVAAAQAVDLSFGLYVVAWLAFGLWGMFGMWTSASGGGRQRAPGVIVAVGSVLVVTLLVIAVLPAPHVAGNVSFPDSAAADAALGGQSGKLAGDSGTADEPARAGTPAGASRVGGFLGFANRLDTALRPALGDQVVMRVRAQRPTYWIGETFDRWNGQSWISTGRHLVDIDTGSPFTVPDQPDQPVTGSADLQTFYMAQYGPNLVFHAPDAHQVWFPSSHVYAGSDGTVVSPLAMGPGTVYTVESEVAQATPAELEASALTSGTLPAAARRQYTQLPALDPRVSALARRVTAGAMTTYDKVEALIRWIGAHTRYSTDIPPLAPGQDAVTAFLFGDRIGFCEQISTALAVMLRSLGIPAREAVGYVPGPYDPITDLYEVQAKDAHSWVQVWFPGYGWQSFDPTAVVPLANPSPGATLVHDAAGFFRGLPLAPMGGVVVAGGLVAVVLRRRRRRPVGWEATMTRRIERAGARAGRPRRTGETLAAYAADLDARAGDPSGTFASLAWLVEESAYGGRAPTEEVQRRAEQTLAAARIPPARRAAAAAGPGRSGGGAPGA